MTGSPRRGNDRRKQPRAAGKPGTGPKGKSRRPPRGSRGRPPAGRDGGTGTQKPSREQRPRKDLRGPARDLPRWVVDALVRVTPAGRVAAALDELGEASLALSEGRFHHALRHSRRAKDLSPRDATVREVLGLSCYRLGNWSEALKELRTYRRFTGEATHYPVEMDALRALGKDREVEDAWSRRGELELLPGVRKETVVVYASFLLDHGRVAEARELASPRRLGAEPTEEDLRVWYVAARAAARAGDAPEARRLRDAILTADPAFPGIEELDTEIAASPNID